MNILKRDFGFSLVLMLAMSGTAFSMGKKPPSEFKAYKPFDATASQVFQQISDTSWEQLKSMPNPRYSDAPDLYVKNLTWKKTLKVGLENSGAQFEFASPTWTNVEGLTSGGAGYSTTIPVKQYGVRQRKDGRYEFMVYARFGDDVKNDANRLNLDIIQPYVIAATEFSEVEAARDRDPACTNALLKWEPTYGCTVISKAFDYALLRFSPVTPDKLEVIGKAFGVEQPVLTVEFTKNQN